MITSIATNLRTYMGSIAVLLMSVSIEPTANAFVGTWVPTNVPQGMRWDYSLTALGGTVTVSGFDCRTPGDKADYYTLIGLGDGVCTSIKQVSDSVVFSCNGGHTIKITPAEVWSKVVTGGFLGVGKAGPCGADQVRTYTIEASDLTQTGLSLMVRRGVNKSMFQAIIPGKLAKCTGSLQSTTLSWEGLKIGDKIPRKTIPFHYKCETGGGALELELAEATVSSEAPKLQYDMGGNIFTKFYQLSCTSSCEDTVDFGVSGKSATTAAGKFQYSLLVSSYQR